jgi:hypothetical protein
MTSSQFAAAARRQEKRAARARPRAASAARSAAFDISAASLPARSAGDAGSKYSAPSPHTSGIDAASAAMTGQPQHIASSGGRPKPS